MATQQYRYIVVGAALTGASAVAGIRELDKEGSILLVGKESHKPYHRPPLTKGLWTGKKKVADIFVNPSEFYEQNRVDVVLDTEIAQIDPLSKQVFDNCHNAWGYDKLLLATGGIPRPLEIPGADLDGIIMYRWLDDFFCTHEQAKPGSAAVVIGGGFIGSEIAAALNMNQVDVTMIYPEAYLVSRVFPEGLGRALQTQYQQRGITTLAGDIPSAIEKQGGRFITQTRNGQRIESDMVIVGVGITPNVTLAMMASLEIANGVTVNEFLQTSDPDIYAAGDNAFFPYQALGQSMRIEHWDNALNQGQHAGRNMAGANQPFTYMPYFFSDLFEFGYEAVGDVNTRLETFADWQQENNTGVIYYLKEGRVRGVMLCNIWGKLDDARELIKRGQQVRPEELRGAIKPSKQEAA